MADLVSGSQLAAVSWQQVQAADMHCAAGPKGFLLSSVRMQSSLFLQGLARLLTSHCQCTCYVKTVL